MQADTTAYYGSVEIGAPLGTDIFKFRIVVNISNFGNDLDAIVTSLVRSNLVEKTFSFSDGHNQFRSKLCVIGSSNSELVDGGSW